jgi:hypothetical protein
VPSGTTVARATIEFNGRLTQLQCADSVRRVRAAPEGAPDSKQYLSGAPPDYPVASPVRARAINTPNHHTSRKIQVFSHHIQYKSSRLHSKTQKQRSNPLQVPNTFQRFSGLRERDICVHLSSCHLDRFSSSPFLFSTPLQSKQETPIVWWSLWGLSDPID